MHGTLQVQQIVALAPQERQTLLFSATMTEDVEQLVHASLRRPLRLAADTADRAPSTLTQEIVRLKVLQLISSAMKGLHGLQPHQASKRSDLMLILLRLICTIRTCRFMCWTESKYQSSSIASSNAGSSDS